MAQLFIAIFDGSMTLIKHTISVLGLLLVMGCGSQSHLPDPLKAGWKGQSVCIEVLNNKEVRILKCTFAPGIGHEKHFHAKHFGYTLAGSKFRIEDTTGIREVDVPTGTHFYSEGVDWHQVLNIGDSIAQFLIVEPKL